MSAAEGIHWPVRSGDEFAVHACFLNVPASRLAFNGSSEINLMSVHGIAERYRGEKTVSVTSASQCGKASAVAELARFLRDALQSRVDVKCRQHCRGATRSAVSAER
jgi:hypothetical protein